MTTSSLKLLSVAVALLGLLPSAAGFGAVRRRAAVSLTTSSRIRRSSPVVLRMRTEEDDAALGPFWGPLINGEDGESYPPFGSLVRQGPVPYFIRLSDKNKYAIAVENYMAQEKCGRRGVHQPRTWRRCPVGCRRWVRGTSSSTR